MNGLQTCDQFAACLKSQKVDLINILHDRRQYFTFMRTLKSKSFERIVSIDSGWIQTLCDLVWYFGDEDSRRKSRISVYWGIFRFLPNSRQKTLHLPPERVLFAAESYCVRRGALRLRRPTCSTSLRLHRASISAAHCAGRVWYDLAVNSWRHIHRFQHFLQSVAKKYGVQFFKWTSQAMHAINDICQSKPYITLFSKRPISDKPHHHHSTCTESETACQSQTRHVFDEHQEDSNPVATPVRAF